MAELVLGAVGRKCCSDTAIGFCIVGTVTFLCVGCLVWDDDAKARVGVVSGSRLFCRMYAVVGGSHFRVAIRVFLPW